MNVSFYRNGELDAVKMLPRAMSPCQGSIELGDSGISLSNLKFFPRALTSNELLDIFSSGATLSEIATGSILDSYEDDAHKSLAVTQQESAYQVLQTQNPKP